MNILYLVARLSQKVKYDDIYCSQTSVFYFSYNVLTIACKAIPTPARVNGNRNVSLGRL